MAPQSWELAWRGMPTKGRTFARQLRIHALKPHAIFKQTVQDMVAMNMQK
jgi:hypothetical protein